MQQWVGPVSRVRRKPLDGRSLLPAAKGRFESHPVFVEHIDGGTPAPRVWIRDGDWKLVCSRAYFAQLFDLADDPFEQNDLAGQSCSAEAKLTAMAEARWRLDRLADDVAASQTA